MGVAGLALALEWPLAGTSPVLAEIGFGIILVTSIVQLLAPRQEWIQAEETLASIAGVLIPRDGEDAEALLRAVDVALRVAKAAGATSSRSTPASRSPTTVRTARARHWSG